MNEIEYKIPSHVAIILDGNGRWALKRGLKRSMGHKAGFDNLKSLSDYIFERGVKILSIFAFSTENFKRDKEEVDYLMNLLVKKFRQLINKKNSVKIIFSGRRMGLREDVLKAIEEIEEKTKNNEDHIFNICFNFGGKFDLIDAAKAIAIDYKNNKINLDTLDEKTFNNYLYNEIPDIDLLIRTSGELRISNFMLYQMAYAEMYFPRIYFPDFNSEAFDEAILVYNKRDCRFGGIKNENKSY